MIAALVLACHPGGPNPGPAPSTSDSSTSSAATGDTSIAPGDTALTTADTSSLPDGPDDRRAPEARLTGEWSLGVGWFLAFDQLDTDPELELVLGETRNQSITMPYAGEPQERVDVVDGGARSGRAVDETWRLAESDPDAVNEIYGFGLFGTGVRVDAPDSAVLIGASVRSDAFDIASFPFPADNVLGPDDAIGMITPSGEFPLLGSRMGTVDLSRGRYVWTGTWETTGPNTFAGQVYLFDLPLVGQHYEDDADAVYRADAGDYVQYGLTDDADLDGDGVLDLVFGAQDRNAVGAVAVLSDPPAGELRIWEVAVATYDGEVPYGRLGEEVATGDLDGDGQPDLLTGAAMVYGSATFHAFRGPTAGAHVASDSDWTIDGTFGLERLGVSSAAGDLDGDGAIDLVVGRPGNPALGLGDGSVLVYRGPLAPGTYTQADAAFALRNARSGGPGPPDTADFFGYFLRTGDLNGDGAAELAISASTDLEDGLPVGSVQILSGRSDLFDPFTGVPW